MRLHTSIPILLALLLNACHPIVVRVGKRSQDAEVSPSVPYHSDADFSTVESWNSVEDFLQRLDAIKQMGEDALLRRYHEDGRQQIRQVFRQFRDAVEAHAIHDPSQDLPYLGGFQAGTCVPIRVRDVFDLGPYGDLRSLLETVFLSKIKPTSALPDPASPGDMDEITKLGFFELGIAMDGESYYKTDQAMEIQGSDLRWKVIHEQGEPSVWAPQDEHGVQFRFMRTHIEPDRNEFVLEARVGDQVYEGQDAASLPSLHINYQRTFADNGDTWQSMLIQTGRWDHAGFWQDLQLSRKIVVTQDILQGRILHVTVHEHFQQEQEIEERFRLDMDAQNLCSELGGQ